MLIDACIPEIHYLSYAKQLQGVGGPVGFHKVMKDKILSPSRECHKLMVDQILKL